jgi:spermidine synthase
MGRSGRASTAPEFTFPDAALWTAVGALGFSSVVTQLALLRELWAAFQGNELTLGVVLGNWLLLTGLGAALGRWTGHAADAEGRLFAGQMFLAVVPLAQVCLVRVWRDVVFVRGADVGLVPAALGSGLVLAPYTVASGYLLTVAVALAAARKGASGIGTVYGADSLGSVVGGLCFTYVLVRWFDHFNLLWLAAWVNLALASGLAFARRRRRLAAMGGGLAVALVAALGLDLDAWSTRRQFHGQTVVYAGNSPYSRLVVTRAGGQLSVLENGVPTFSWPAVERNEETVCCALAQRPEARAVLLIQGGVAGTARELLTHGAVQVTYVELDGCLLDLGRRFLPQNLADPRLRVIVGDGRRHVRETTNRYDLVIVDVPDPVTSQLNRYYTVEFLGEVKRVLAPGGVVSFGLGRYENTVSPELAQVLATAQRTVQAVFAHSLLLPLGRVFFLASDGPLHADIATRLEQRGLSTQFVKRAYLDAMLTPDRLADMTRAAAQPAPRNTDARPVLYFQHLRHWLSQFSAPLGITVLVLGVAWLGYAARLPGAALVVFGSGFTASALEVVLLLFYQVLCGSLYRQLGIVVSLFMLGLALGAGAVNWLRVPRTRAALAVLAFCLAGFSGALPWALAVLGRADPAGASLASAPVVIPGLTLVLGVLVGAVFPLAGQVQGGLATSTAARLYAADFVGAWAGALGAGAVLIPVIGLAAVCWLTAGLNLAFGLAALTRTADRNGRRLGPRGDSSEGKAK